MLGKKGKTSCKIDQLITKFKSCTRKICITMYTENSKWLYAKIVIQCQEPMMGSSQCIFLMRIKPMQSIGFSGLQLIVGVLATAAYILIYGKNLTLKELAHKIPLTKQANQMLGRGNSQVIPS